MINRQLLNHKVQTLTDTEVAEVLEYINIMEAVNQQANTPDPLEEAILTLLLESIREEPSRRQKPLTN